MNRKIEMAEKVYRADTTIIIYDGPIQGEAVSFAKNWQVSGR